MSMSLEELMKTDPTIKKAVEDTYLENNKITTEARAKNKELSSKIDEIEKESRRYLMASKDIETLKSTVKNRIKKYEEMATSGKLDKSYATGYLEALSLVINDLKQLEISHE